MLDHASNETVGSHRLINNSGNQPGSPYRTRSMEMLFIMHELVDYKMSQTFRTEGMYKERNNAEY